MVLYSKKQYNKTSYKHIMLSHTFLDVNRNHNYPKIVQNNRKNNHKHYDNLDIYICWIILNVIDFHFFMKSCSSWNLRLISYNSLLNCLNSSSISRSIFAPLTFRCVTISGSTLLDFRFAILIKLFRTRRKKDRKNFGIWNNE